MQSLLVTSSCPHLGFESRTGGERQPWCGQAHAGESLARRWPLSVTRDRRTRHLTATLEPRSRFRDYFSYPAEPRRRFLWRGAPPALPGLGTTSQPAQLRVQSRRHWDGWAERLLVLVLLPPTWLARSFGLSCTCKVTLISSPLPKSWRRWGEGWLAPARGSRCGRSDDKRSNKFFLWTPGVQQSTDRNSRPVPRSRVSQPLPASPLCRGVEPQLEPALNSPVPRRLAPSATGGSPGTGGTAGHLLPRCVSKAERERSRNRRGDGAAAVFPAGKRSGGRALPCVPATPGPAARSLPRAGLLGSCVYEKVWQ